MLSSDDEQLPVSPSQNPQKSRRTPRSSTIASMPMNVLKGNSKNGFTESNLKKAFGKRYLALKPILVSIGILQSKNSANRLILNLNKRLDLTMELVDCLENGYQEATHTSLKELSNNIDENVSANPHKAAAVLAMAHKSNINAKTHQLDCLVQLAQLYRRIYEKSHKLDDLIKAKDCFLRAYAFNKTLAIQNLSRKSVIEMGVLESFKELFKFDAYYRYEASKWSEQEGILLTQENAFFNSLEKYSGNELARRRFLHRLLRESLGKDPELSRLDRHVRHRDIKSDYLACMLEYVKNGQPEIAQTWLKLWIEPFNSRHIFQLLEALRGDLNIPFNLINPANLQVLVQCLKILEHNYEMGDEIITQDDYLQVLDYLIQYSHRDPDADPIVTERRLITLYALGNLEQRQLVLNYPTMVWFSHACANNTDPDEIAILRACQNIFNFDSPNSFFAIKLLLAPLAARTEKSLLVDYFLGLIHLIGGRGITQDFSQALTCFENILHFCFTNPFNKEIIQPVLVLIAQLYRPEETSLIEAHIIALLENAMKAFLNGQAQLYLREDLKKTMKVELAHAYPALRRYVERSFNRHPEQFQAMRSFLSNIDEPLFFMNDQGQEMMLLRRSLEQQLAPEKSDAFPILTTAPAEVFLNKAMEDIQEAVARKEPQELILNNLLRILNGAIAGQKKYLLKIQDPEVRVFHDRSVNVLIERQIADINEFQYKLFESEYPKLHPTKDSLNTVTNWIKLFIDIVSHQHQQQAIFLMQLHQQSIAQHEVTVAQVEAGVVAGEDDSSETEDLSYIQGSKLHADSAESSSDEEDPLNIQRARRQNYQAIPDPEQQPVSPVSIAKQIKQQFRVFNNKQSAKKQQNTDASSPYLESLRKYYQRSLDMNDENKIDPALQRYHFYYMPLKNRDKKYHGQAIPLSASHEGRLRAAGIKTEIAWWDRRRMRGNDYQYSLTMLGCVVLSAIVGAGSWLLGPGAVAAIPAVLDLNFTSTLNVTASAQVFSDHLGVPAIAAWVGNSTENQNKIIQNVNITYGSVNGTHSALHDTIHNTDKLSLDLIIWVTTAAALLGLCIAYLLTKLPFPHFIAAAEDTKIKADGTAESVKFHGHRFRVIPAESQSAELLNGFGLFGRKEISANKFMPAFSPREELSHSGDAVPKLGAASEQQDSLEMDLFRPAKKVTEALKLLLMGGNSLAAAPKQLEPVDDRSEESDSTEFSLNFV